MLGFSSTDPMNPMNFSALTFEDHTLKGATKARPPAERSGAPPDPAGAGRAGDWRVSGPRSNEAIRHSRIANIEPPACLSLRGFRLAEQPEAATARSRPGARHIFENGDGISVVRFSLKWIECAMITK